MAGWSSILETNPLLRGEVWLVITEVSLELSMVVLLRGFFRLGVGPESLPDSSDVRRFRSYGGEIPKMLILYQRDKLCILN